MNEYYLGLSWSCREIWIPLFVVYVTLVTLFMPAIYWDLKLRCANKKQQAYVVFWTGPAGWIGYPIFALFILIIRTIYRGYHELRG